MAEHTQETSEISKNTGKLVIISGPSGVGKGTICKQLLENNSNFYLSVSATTRAMRPNEVDGVHYHFKTKDEFEAMIENDALLEWAEYNDNYYGTPVQAVQFQINKGQNVLLEIEVKGALQVRERFNEACLVFIAPPSLEELEKRLRGRGNNPEEEILERMKISKWELSQKEQFDHTQVNDNLKACIDEIQAFLKL